MKTKKAFGYSEQKIIDPDKALLKFSQKFMSNSKWIRLIEAIIENSQEFKKILFKKIQNEKIGVLYLDENSIFEFDYWKTAFEGNNSFNDWLEYREIEYLIFQKTVDSRTNQDVEKISAVIKSAGEFYLESDEHELKLICYKE